MLARALARPSNVLVLDEPTNDLDLETLDVLEEMLGDYDGTIILISHDRDFLDRVVGAVVAPEGGGRWTEYAGGYSDMLAQRGEDLTREAMKQAPAKEVKAATEAQPRERKSVKRRLSFHEKHALETLPQTILALTEKVRALHGRLDDSRPLRPRSQVVRRNVRGARVDPGGIGGRGSEVAGAGNSPRGAGGRIVSP
jgi:ATP-binding cassette subfamily F protein uup